MTVKIKKTIYKTYLGEKLRIKAGLIGKASPTAQGKYYFSSDDLKYDVYDLDKKYFEVIK